jgi:transposase InsO family protein
MPWLERSIVSLRKDFVLAVLSEEMTVVDACKHFGISRKTGYKWLGRFESAGIAGLVDQTRRPRASPTQISETMRAEIAALRRAHPTWGGKKLHRLLVRMYGAQEAPAPKTIERVLRAAGLVRRWRRRPKTLLVADRETVVAAAPNDVWTVDFKGWWKTGDQTRCEPLTVRDAFSRYMLLARAVPSTSRAEVRPLFEALFARYGLPVAIQSDNGSPFARTNALGGLTKLSAWWLSLGIKLVRSRPGCPQDNGGHERMHADMYRELERRGAPTLAAQQKRIDDWLVEFNHVRPHEALGMRTPAHVYKPSPRLYRMRGCYDYPDGWRRVKLGPQGKGYFGPRRKIFVSLATAGHVAGLEPVKGGYHVWLGPQLLGHLPAEAGKVAPDVDSVQPGRLPVSPPTGALATEAQVLYTPPSWGDDEEVGYDRIW